VLTRITALPALVLAAGLIAAGCGDDEDDTTAATPSSARTTAGATGATGEPLSKEEFIAEADAICQAGDDEVDAAGQDFFREGGSPGKAEEKAFILQVVVPNVQKQLDQIAELTPPEGDEDEVQAILESAQQGIDKIEKDPSLLGTAENPLDEGTKLAAEYGLEVCGQS
jgi:hypothetical protein